MLRQSGAVTDTSIRESRPGDGAGCAEIWLETGEFMAALNPRSFQVPAADGLAAWFEQINAVYRHDQDKLLLVADADGILVGAVTASLHQPLDTAARQVQSDLSRRRLHIDSLSVVASHRRSGIGSALMRAAEQWGRSRGAEVVLLETETNNPLSIPFYEQRMGFSAQAVIFRKEIDPAQ
jgi:ribosomal protein S18 acetylase RimI-like enzyme